MREKQFLDASSFLKALDSNAKEFTFQIFDDLRPKRKHLAEVFSGTLSEHWDRLVDLNNKKLGIHVAIQETDLKGRKKENIKNIRAIIADNDGNKIDIEKLPLSPSIVVESSTGNSHLYYLLDKKMSTSNGHKAGFELINQYLIEHGADPGAKDIAHTLRLPGFLNWKHHEPVWCKVSQGYQNSLKQPLKYSFEDLRDHFKPSKKPSKKDDYQNEKKQDLIIRPFQNALVSSALQKIDPDSDYPIWRDVGMAIHHSSQGSRQGYELFQNWSANGASYSESDWPNVWNSFSNGKDSVKTFGTIDMIARECGWNGWYSSDIPEFRKAIKRERVNYFEWLNQFYGLIPVGHKMLLVYHARNELGYYGYQLMSERAAMTYFAPISIPLIKTTRNETQVIKEPVYKRWVEWDGRNIYEGFKFEPSADIKMGKNPKVLKKGTRYNTYLGLTNEGSEQDCECIKDHIFEVWCKGDQKRFDYVINWLARMYQFPGKPAETLIVLTSRPGAGKNIILDELVKSFGRFGKTDKAGDDVTSEFNSIIMDAVFILVGEASFDTQAKQRAVLNTLATQDRIGAQKKFEDTREINNCVHLVCLSNEDRPIKIQIGDRRVFVLACDGRYIDNFDYFSKLSEKIKGGAVDGFIHYLKKRKIDNFRPQEMPDSEPGLKASMIADDKHGFLSYIRRALEEDNFDYNNNPEKNYGLDQENHIPTNLIIQAYYRHCEELKSGNKRVDRYSQIAVFRKMNEIFGRYFVRKRESVKNKSGKREYYYEIGTLRELRRAFDNYMGAPHDWGPSDDDDDLDFLEL